MYKDVEEIQDIITECSKLGYALKQVACMNQKLLLNVLDMNAYGEKSLVIDRMLEEICINFFKNIPSISVVISEESGCIDLHRGRFTVIIDPLDGTKNYTMGLSYYACSVAILNEKGEVYGAYVVNLANGHEFTAIKGCGAFRNGTQIYTATHSDLNQCDGIFVGLSKREQDLQAIKRVVVQLSSYRAMGCAALDLCCLAMGAISIFVDISYTAKLVDVIASSLILSEAGGAVTDEKGVPIIELTTQGCSMPNQIFHKKFCTIGAANSVLKDSLMSTLGITQNTHKISYPNI
ncbi:inositol monophosphatase family protein [Paenibacillus chitinolyticus]|uniref:inositol monophosphatase family protein n=1 Tax=Paenibacillus chitinolyticus TaxID=79263 RepID=UPI0035DEAD43